ncbi:MAG: MAPEG family protein [Candidatus Binatia bacterium]|jgi:uncharacterized MAPEG superfamily protein|nr:MAPEG family protein [Candidatus Binatia bacterium]MDG2009821.1 MAPEG family protein [Candidatus Binatia bacterium]HAC80831.1 glutathione metabolism protein [Deltaproteobacteria bacterium]
MEPFLGDPAFRTFAVCTAILVLKMLGVSFYTAIQRRTSSGYTNPEDTAFADEGVEASEVENAGVARALRIHRNDMESIPLFFAIGLVYVLLGASAFGATLYFWGFTGSRVLHTIAYARGMQPARALLWGFGTLCLIGMSIKVLTQLLA